MAWWSTWVCPRSKQLFDIILLLTESLSFSDNWQALSIALGNSPLRLIMKLTWHGMSTLQSQENEFQMKFIRSPRCLRSSIKPNREERDDGQEMNFSHEVLEQWRQGRLSMTFRRLPALISIILLSLCRRLLGKWIVALLKLIGFMFDQMSLASEFAVFDFNFVVVYFGIVVNKQTISSLNFIHSRVQCFRR